LAVEFEISHLKKSFGKTKALQDIDLVIRQGEMAFLLGANGSGKSTLLKVLAGHLDWSEGEVSRRGQSRKRDHPDFNWGLHLISEEIIPPKVPVRELKKVYADIYRSWDEEIFQRVQEWTRLDESQSLHVVSRGQRIQGLLALTLATRPETLLVDEATAVLDPFIRNRLLIEVSRLNRGTGMTVVIATNIATEVASLKGRALIMSEGRIKLDRLSEELEEGFVKVRLREEGVRAQSLEGLSFLRSNGDGTMSFIGQASDLQKLSLPYEEDRRALTIEEVFIYYSDRRLA
jgi:ABC-type multidrug transport system ATPase subunit